MSRILDAILGLHGAVGYLVVGLVVFAEDALFIGFVLPGETAVVLGGVAASRHHASVVAMAAVVVLAAIIGDSAGYKIGARYGARLLSTRVLRGHADRIEAARTVLARHGGPAVFAGRFTPFGHAVMPFLAGTARMRYPPIPGLQRRRWHSLGHRQRATRRLGGQLLTPPSSTSSAGPPRSSPPSS